ncbi:Cof-type HAD-IIB family hydrolase [Metabacillus sp. GX 13764]|uniref:Cof-type HAD-IIB family hydrolase n=1 Tax=Metabacillus kandeliae TaxID=2900151 RepID=UPI001E484A93|nr:Cof-type HAD-IIB family hydrolase [Metabacillus kandeliae]
MKLIAIDLDGTLLSSKIKISEENIAAIRKTQESGHVVMVCSGRAPEDIKKILKDHHLDCPVAGSNGTVVYIKEKLLHMVSLAENDAKTVAAILEDDHMPYRVYTSHGIYVPKKWSQYVSEVIQSGRAAIDNLKAKEYTYITEQPKENDMIKVFDEVSELLDNEVVAIQKFFILTLDMDQKEKLSKVLGNMEGVNVTTSGQLNLEVMEKNGNKAAGLRAVAEHFGIKIEDTVAIGDNFNDLPMLEAAGLSVAMGNGDPEIKKLCDVITLANDENGVAYALDKYVLQ